MGISGTYDVLIVPLFLRKEDVLDLLPAHVQGLPQEDVLLEPPEEHIEAYLQNSKGENVPLSASDVEEKGLHPILLQLGYQHSTGPGPKALRLMSFSEAKVEVPYLSHPSLRGSDDITKSKCSFDFKQSIISSNSVITLGSRYQAGLHSMTATFDPKDSPSAFAPNAPTLAYEAKGYLKAEAKRIAFVDQVDKQRLLGGWEVFQRVVQMPWFGDATKDGLTTFQFDFENAEIPPLPYEVDIEMNLGKFQSKASRTIQQTSIGWRVKAGFISKATKVANMS